MNTLQQAKKLIENYCKHYGIKTIELKRNSRQYPHKLLITKDKHVNTAYLLLLKVYADIDESFFLVRLFLFRNVCSNFLLVF